MPRTYPETRRKQAISSALGVSIDDLSVPRRPPWIGIILGMARVRITAVFAPGTERDGEVATWVAEASATMLALLREAQRSQRPIDLEIVHQQFRVTITDVQDAPGSRLSKHRLATPIKLYVAP